MTAILDFWSNWFYLLLICKLPQYFLPSFKSTGLSVQEMMGQITGGQLGFPIRTILAIFYLKVAKILPTKLRVNWPFGSGEEAQNRFSRRPPWQPTWFSYFRSLKSPWYFLPSFESNGNWVQEKKCKNRFSKWLPWQPTWISDLNYLPILDL